MQEYYNQNKFKYQTLFLTKFNKEDEDDEVFDEIELYNIIIINQKLTQSDIDNIDIRSQLQRQTQNRELKNSG